MEAQIVHQTGHWIVATDCSNTFNTAKRTAILAQIAQSIPGLVPYNARCYDEIPAKAIYEMDSRAPDDRMQEWCTAGRWNGTAPVLLCPRPDYL